MKLSISQAAKLAGVSRSHFYKSYLKNNRISVEKDYSGKKVIDKSEIMRVFGKICENTSKIRRIHRIQTWRQKMCCSNKRFVF